MEYNKQWEDWGRHFDPRKPDNQYAETIHGEKMLVKKITEGHVTQVFDTETGEFVSQSFTAGDIVDYEDGSPNIVNKYLPFDMVQPGPSIGRMMEVAQDIKKSFIYNKSDGCWYWHDRDEPNMDKPFDSFEDALKDATAPYFEESE